MTLEEYFYSFAEKPECFPGKHDLVSAYISFKDFMNSEVHKEVKSMTRHIDGSIYLNDHSADHVQMVMEKVSKILWDDNKEVLRIEPFECFILLSAIQIHDAGHVLGGRNHHEKNAKEFLKEYNSYIVGSPEKKIIYEIARAHSGKDDPIGKLPQSEEVSNFRVRMRMLAALLRLGDEMADEASRASEYLYEKDKVVEESRLFHAFSISLSTFLPHPHSHDVRMKFNLNRKRCDELYKKGDSEVFLLDEIYERSFKTFHECLYYNRFVPDTIRLNTVDVVIDFYDDEDLDPFFPSISYRLEEKGYPTIQEQDVYELCGSDLCKDGKKLNGEFVKNKIAANGNQE